MQRSTSFSRRVGFLYRGAAALVLNTIIVVIFLEAAAIVFFKLKSLLHSPPKTGYEQMASLPYYISQYWALDYWREHFQVSTGDLGEYSPYVIWRRASLKGKMITVDKHGIRLTPGADCTTDAYKIFAFGGSTMWGYGAPNWGTIPAYLQAGLKTPNNRPVCVVNYGEFAYVSTQSLIELERQLQSKDVPDMVVFYDGVNDTEAAYETGQAGVHLYVDTVAALINRGGRQVHVSQNPFVQWMEQSASFKLFKKVFARLRGGQSQSVPLASHDQAMRPDTVNLSASVVQAYLTNYRIVEALARTYHFKYIFFWQPIVGVGNKTLTKEEQAFKAEFGAARLEFFNAVYEKIELASIRHRNLHYIANVFDQMDSQIYVDSHHVTPEGNQLVARKMLDVINGQLVRE